MKVTKIGWCAKTFKPHVIHSEWDGACQIEGVYPTKGKEDYWEKGEWPPRKIRITVEDCE